MSPKTLKAIFLRKGGAGSYTQVGNLIPGGLLPEEISESDTTFTKMDCDSVGKSRL